MMLRLVPKFLVHRKNILDGKAFTVYKYSMPAIRHYSYNGCAATLGAIPGGTAFLKIKSKPAPGRPQAISAVDWLGFICKAGARRLPFARPGKLVASYVTNGDYLAHEWKPLRSDQYVLCMIMQNCHNCEISHNYLNLLANDSRSIDTPNAVLPSVFPS